MTGSYLALAAMEVSGVVAIKKDYKSRHGQNRAAGQAGSHLPSKLGALGMRWRLNNSNEDFWASKTAGLNAKVTISASFCQSAGTTTSPLWTIGRIVTSNKDSCCLGPLHAEPDCESVQPL